MKLKALMLLGFFCTSALFAAENPLLKMSAYSRIKLNEAVNAKNLDNTILNKKYQQHPYSIKNNKLYVDLLAEITPNFNINKLIELECKIKTNAGNIYALSVPVENLEILLAVPEITSAEVSKRYKLNMDKSKSMINAANVIGNNQITPSGLLAGENVVVGIYDTGIDVSHPDFKNANGTRILKLWDMSDKISGKAPQGYDFGREWTKEEIDLNMGAVTEKDKDGHGTHVAGTAAGSGNNDAQFRGIAYNADMIIVKGVRDDIDQNFDDADIIAGCKYIADEAKKLGKPCVINLSLGTTIGPHDGKELLDKGLSSLVQQGVILVAAAGNDGEMPIHAGDLVNEGEIVEFPISPMNVCDYFEGFCPDDPNYYMTAADVWYETGLTDSLYLVCYNETFTPINMMGFKLGSAVQNKVFLNQDGDTVAFITADMTTTNSTAHNAGNIMFQIHNNGNPEVQLYNYMWSYRFNIKKSGRIDMWAGIPIPEQYPLPDVGIKFIQGNNKMLVGSPGTADSLVCVGSFVSKNSWKDKNDKEHDNDWIIGSYSTFSSKGPSRDGRMLPHISAPGQIIFSVKSNDAQEESEVTLANGYWGMNGTSMATPHVTGAIALMLQVNPKLGYSDIIKVLKTSAKTDNYTGTQPNNTYGYGKLNVQAAINYLLTGSDVKYVEINNSKVYPIPAKDRILIDIPELTENSTIRLFDNDGREISKSYKYNYIISGENSKVELDLNNLKSGVYNGYIQNADKQYKFRFVVSE